MKKLAAAAVAITALTAAGAMAQSTGSTQTSPTATSGAETKGTPDTSQNTPAIGATPQGGAPGQSPGSKADAAKEGDPAATASDTKK